MSRPESPTIKGSSNSARIPASLTSLHNPWNAGAPITKSTLKPVVMRGSRYTNLRMLSNSLIPVGPSRLKRRDKYVGEIDPLYLSARNPAVSVRRLDLFKDSKSGRSVASLRLGLPSSIEMDQARPYWPGDYVTATSMIKIRGGE